MPAAGKGCAAVVGCSHVATEECSARTRAGVILDALLRSTSSSPRLRYGEIIQACDVRHGHVQIERGLTIRRIESAVFSGMLIDSHHHMEGFVDLRHRAIDIDEQAIRRRIGHCKTIGPGEIDHGLVILHRWAELLCELSYGQKMAVVGAGWVIEPI